MASLRENLRGIASRVAGAPRDTQRLGHTEPERWCGLEMLEQRLLLSATIAVDPSDEVQITGDDGADMVILREQLATGRLEYSFDGIDFSADLDPVTEGDQTVAASGAKVKVDLGAGADRLEIVDAAGRDVFAVSATNTKLGASNNALSVDHANVELLALSGEAGADVFKMAMVSGDGPAVEIDGGDGSDTLIGADKANTWNITGTNEGSLKSSQNNGDSDPPIAFAQIENLTGGDGNDEFVLADGAGVTGMIEGGGGFNTLDYSAYTSGVEVGIGLEGTGVATGTGGIANMQHVIFGLGTTGNQLIVAGLPVLHDVTGTSSFDEIVLVDLDLSMATGGDADTGRLVEVAKAIEQAPSADAVIETIRLPEGSLTVTETEAGHTGVGPGQKFNLLYLARGPPAGADGALLHGGSVTVMPDDQLLVVAINPEDSGTTL
ncbi:MAG: LEPR-XLL domain-containing protein, partial [Planctomycetota bacterium]